MLWTLCFTSFILILWRTHHIYTDSNKIPKHVARQLPNGQWTNKLGQERGNSGRHAANCSKVTSFGGA
ncbi:DUF7689 domain-containing protein [Dulcicalothrix desertica]|uniref:DUF7689 domain-containing protein n=1 Tax=Dulcicalothrix desertica TaxID=32056 RepID=UPI000F8C45BE